MRSAVPILIVLAVASSLALIGLAGSLEPVSVVLLIILIILGTALGAARRGEPAPPPEPEVSDPAPPRSGTSDDDVAPGPDASDEHVEPAPDTVVERVPLVPPPAPGRAGPEAALKQMAVTWGIVATLALGTAVGAQDLFADTSSYDSPALNQSLPDYTIVSPLRYPGWNALDPYPVTDPPVDFDGHLGPAPSVLLNGAPGASAEVQIMGLYDSCPASCGEAGARDVTYTIRVRNTGTVPVAPWPGVDGWAEDALGSMHLAGPAGGPAYPPIAPGAEAFRIVEVQVPPESILLRFHIGLRLGDVNRIATLDWPGN